jgi:hypothetical protein
MATQIAKIKTITAPGMVGHILKRLYSIDIRNGNMTMCCVAKVNFHQSFG